MAKKEPRSEKAKEVMSSRTSSSFLQILNDSNFIYCILEDYKIELINKKSMRLVKEIDLFDSLAAKILKMTTATSADANREMIHAVINNGVIYLQLVEGYLVILEVDPASINDYRVFYHQLPYKDYRFAASHDNTTVYVFTNTKLEFFKVMPFDKVTASCFSICTKARKRTFNCLRNFTTGGSRHTCLVRIRC